MTTIKPTYILWIISVSLHPRYLCILPNTTHLTCRCTLKIGPSQSGNYIFKAVMVIVLTLVWTSSYLDFCFHQTLTSWLCIFSFSPASDPVPHLLHSVGWLPLSLGSLNPGQPQDKPSDTPHQFEQWPSQPNHHSLPIRVPQFLMKSKTNDFFPLSSPTRLGDTCRIFLRGVCVRVSVHPIWVFLFGGLFCICFFGMVTFMFF